MKKLIIMLALLVACIGFNSTTSEIVPTSQDLPDVEQWVRKYTLSERTSAYNLKIPVLLYHHILSDAENINEKENPCVVSLEGFDEQMKYLHDNGYYTITSNELYDYLYENKPLPNKSVFIQFDDGYQSNLERAYPVLKKYNFKATIFLITSYMPEVPEEFKADNLSFLSKEDVSLDKYADVFEFASHTHNLHQVDAGATSLMGATFDDIISDLNLSFETVNSDISFAYPLGQYDKNVIEALKASGIKLAFTVNGGYVEKRSDPYELNRFVIYRDTSIKNFQNILIKSGKH